MSSCGVRPAEAQRAVHRALGQLGEGDGQDALQACGLEAGRRVGVSGREIGGVLDHDGPARPPRVHQRAAEAAPIDGQGGRSVSGAAVVGAVDGERDLARLEGPSRPPGGRPPPRCRRRAPALSDTRQPRHLRGPLHVPLLRRGQLFELGLVAQRADREQREEGDEDQARRPARSTSRRTRRGCARSAAPSTRDRRRGPSGGARPAGPRVRTRRRPGPSPAAAAPLRGSSPALARSASVRVPRLMKPMGCPARRSRPAGRARGTTRRTPGRSARPRTAPSGRRRPSPRPRPPRRAGAGWSRRRTPRCPARPGGRPRR